ncbi:biopolymer transporter ExbD [Prosthecobacter sp. SYSU 5D2]|uniref:ExbD/TolR family protein n=1 Tax=Prosthecobacter sp. SYSU 5D2 TaxID=3134134 RepID=UPI0031FEE034
MKRASQRHLPVYVNQVNITALLDLVLVLLLVFIVAVPFLRREKVVETVPLVLPEELPKRDSVPKERILLVIQRDQKIVLEGKTVTGEQLMPEIKKQLATRPDSGVLVKMPSNFAAGSLARLMEEMNRAGVRHTAVEVVESSKP